MEKTIECQPNYAPAHYNYALLLKEAFNRSKDAPREYTISTVLNRKFKAKVNDEMFGEHDRNTMIQ